jgi:hypothetical protein
MKTDVQKPLPKKAAKSLDDEIALLQEKLARLQAQKREKERKELERNQKAITTFLRNEKLDMVPVEKWTAALPGLRKLLKVDEPKAIASSTLPSTSRPTQTDQPAREEQDAAASRPVQSGGLEAAGQTY